MQLIVIIHLLNITLGGAMLGNKATSKTTPKDASSTENAPSSDNTSLTGVTRLPEVTSLDLSNRGLNAVNLPRALRQYPHLRTLNLFNNDLRHYGVSVLNSYTSLTSLNLDCCDISHVWNFESNVALTSLSLRHNLLESVHHLARNTTLKSLNLLGNKITDRGGALSLADMPSLTSLNLSYNNILPYGAQNLALSTSLTSLDLTFNPIGIVGIQAFLSTTRLRKLNVSYDFGDYHCDPMLCAALERRIDNNLSIFRQIRLKRHHLLAILILFARARHENSDGNFWAKLPLDLSLLIIEKLAQTSITSDLMITPEQLQQTYQFAVDYFTLHKRPSTALPYPYSRLPQFLISLKETLHKLITSVYSETAQARVLVKDGPSGAPTPLTHEIFGLHQLCKPLIEQHEALWQQPTVTTEHCRTYVHTCDALIVQLEASLEKTKDVRDEEARTAQLKTIYNKLRTFRSALKQTDEYKEISTSPVQSSTIAPRLG
jgi:hypothetical protein